MKKVFKYWLEDIFSGKTIVQIPIFSSFLKIGMQGDTMYAWFEVDTAENETEPWDFYIFGTGHEIPDGVYHLETIFDGGFVWHIYAGYYLKD